ncbi:hypothetical protein SAMN05216298_3591 [Glycomyces sambucus]|uniref:Uncharacterized protein n=1 Tax=Glycomyces sambucus TaxID=380244 RepID=A0A1G9JDY0_9ACTN|nr:hypothetical protein [Glycomyces sambucus]SDL35789.1 hypothetical protein SAMN05216298_3591 [Glycomyces sambucus]
MEHDTEDVTAHDRGSSGDPGGTDDPGGTGDSNGAEEHGPAGHRDSDDGGTGESSGTDASGGTDVVDSADVADGTDTSDGTAEPRITVEPGIPRPVGKDDPAPKETFEGCPHRVRVRDLTPGGRILFTTGLLAVLTAGLVQLLALFAGGFLLSIGAEFNGRMPIATGLLLVLGSMFGMIGVFALVGTWRRLHRPEAPIPWLTGAGALLTLAAAILIGLWLDLPYAALAALPSAAVAAHLVHLRALLAPRETCDTDPELPAPLAEWLRTTT